ncbi:uncharacterized protein LOC143283303 [Babylonia areolata]|uniref:uncharacterized protein LOC143283303 n=1 Tax=Babylonia areolata TaxID=304850 RepID=UPI003FD65724
MGPLPLSLPLLLLCCVPPFLTTACSVLPCPDGLHVRCLHGSVSSLPDLDPDDVVWLDLRLNNLTRFPQCPAHFLSRVQHVDVSHNHLTELRRQDLRGARDLRSLSVSYNRLRFVGEGSFGNLSALTTLLLDHNQLTWLADSAFLELPHLLTMNLQNNNLTSLSSGTFRGLENLASLDLSHNRLETLGNNTFTDLIRLRTLTVSSNHLHRLEPLAFVGLGLLTKLNLNMNQLLVQQNALPPGVFAPLKFVRVFSLDYNADDASTDGFPQAVFNDLVSVENISIDSFYDPYFGADFAQMSTIHSLYLYHACRAHRLTNDTFLGFKNSSLQTIVATFCHRLVFVEKCAFCDLPHLKYLYLSHNMYLSPTMALLSLYGLQGQTMEEIDLKHNAYLLPRVSTVDHRNTQYLRNICVHRFSMARSHILRWTASAVGHMTNTDFARCNEHIDISQNNLMGDLSALFLMLSLFKNLTSLQTQQQKVFSLRDSACFLDGVVGCGHRGKEKTTMTASISIPPKLSYMNLSSMSGHFNPPPLVLNFGTAASLKTLDLSYGVFSHCLTTLTGLHHLETLDLSGNYCDKISDNLLDHLPSLKHLFLSNSRLTVTDLRMRAHRILSQVTMLETLDLSRNSLLQIEGDTLPGQKRLRTLLLSHNIFRSLPIDIDLHPNLTVLDLSFNTITSLTSSEQSSLDTLASRHQVRLALKGNPLRCTCTELDFLHWLRDTAVTLDGEEDNSTRRYTCTADSGELTDTERVTADWDALWRHCMAAQISVWTSAVFTLQIVGLLIAYTVSRHWTHLRHACKVLRRLREPKRQDFRKDVYIAYADDDAELACVHLPRCLQGHGLRVLLRQQEEQPGIARVESIVQFIEDSWKVVLLVTRAFAEDEDGSCGFTVQQVARCGLPDALPSRLFVVFTEDPRRLPPTASLDKVLRPLCLCPCPARNVFHVPRNTPVHHPLWDRLAGAILEE